MAEDMKLKIKEFIERRFKPDHELTMDEELIETNIIDSFGTLELAEFVESEFSVKMPDKDLISEKIGSVNLIVAYIEACRE